MNFIFAGVLILQDFQGSFEVIYPLIRMIETEDGGFTS